MKPSVFAFTILLLSMPAYASGDPVPTDWIRGLRDMARQFSTTMMHQAQILGTYFDAKEQLETQRSLQLRQALAHKDYHTSETICRVGTFARSLAASEQLKDFNAAVIAQRMMDRSNMLGGTSSATSDHNNFSRKEQFRRIYCDSSNMNENIQEMCEQTAFDPERYNNDINYGALLGSKLTLNVDFTDDPDDPGLDKATADEEDILALGRNLYDYNLWTPPAEIEFRAENPEEVSAKVKKTLGKVFDQRSLTALRSIAYNSFGELAALKSSAPRDSESAAPFMKAYIKDMGLTDPAEIEALLGENPSYFAQMTMLTKILYQNPDFYTALIDKPANVERMKVAGLAIQLMHNHDKWEAALRREMVISAMLEAALRNTQRSGRPYRSPL